MIDQGTSASQTPNTSQDSRGVNAQQIQDGLGGTQIGGSPAAALGLPFGLDPGATQFGNVSDVDDGFEPNILSSVEQPAYHFTLKMLSDIDGGESITIAESGTTTGFNITDVKVKQHVGPNNITRNTGYAKFTIVLVEPLGASLFDKLEAGSKKIGVQNWRRCNYQLDLRFVGYEPESSMPLDNIGGNWSWIMKFTNIPISVSAAGAKYTITALRLNDYAMENHYAIIDSGFSATASTIGDYFGEVKDYLEKQQEGEYGYIRHRYKFQVYPVSQDYGVMGVSPMDPNQWQIQTGDFSTQHSRQTSMNGNIGETNVGASTGTSIEAMVTDIFSNTKQGQILVTRSQNPEMPSNESENAVIWKVQSEVSAWGYDAYDNDYNYDIVYHIIPHISNAGMLSTEQRADADNGPLSRSKMDRMKRKGMIKKKYDYIFTGLNTEVINFDIDSNIAFYAFTPKPFSATRGATEYAEKANADAEQSQQYSSLQSQFAGIRANSIAAQNSQRALSVADITSNIGQLANVRDQIDAFTAQLSNLASFDGLGRLNSPTGNAPQFLENISVGTGSLQISFDRDSNKTYAEANQEVEAGVFNGRDNYGMFISQAFGAKLPLMKLELTVRGDPYWLGNTMAVKPGDEDQSSPQFIAGDNSIILEFMFPNGIDSSGVPILEKSGIFCGWYVVNIVEHTFTAGKFTQILSGYRNINANTCTSQVGAAQSTTTAPSVVPTPTQSSPASSPSPTPSPIPTTPTFGPQ